MANVSFNELITFTRATGGGRFNAQGQYEWLSSDQPRFDFDPVTLEPRGILIEEQRTNLLLRSAEFDDAGWTKARCSVTTNATAAPDGTTTADKLVEDVSANTHLIEEVLAVTSGVTYTFSVYVKAAGRTHVLIQMFLGGSNGVVVNLKNGSAITSSDSNYTITSVGNDWYRISKTFTSLTTGPGYFDIYPHNGTATNYTGDGTSGIYIWGAQLEVGSFPTSYIPTTTAQVTRAADLCSVNNLSPWYRADQGTLMVEASTNKPLGIATVFAASLVDPSAPSSNHVLIGRFTESSLTARLAGPGGSPFATLTILSPYTAGTTYRSALAWRSGDIAAGANGGTVVKSLATFPNIPVGVLQIGALTSTSGLLNGHIRRIRYIPRCISDTELQALTAI